MVPNAVVELVLKEDVTPAEAWRRHLRLIEAKIAARMGVTQSAYALLVAKKTRRQSSRNKIAKALGIEPEQLDI